MELLASSLGRTVRPKINILQTSFAARPQSAERAKQSNCIYI